ncbi:MAG: hypothetical protein PF482_21100 [Desulfobacteraceae bacterium]|nr:hypothetical protein [Desulfobacteraceae bacterium]
MTADDMRASGLKVNDAYVAVPTLVVPGTSISFAEIEEYLEWLLDHGYPVVSIENPIGGPLDTGINPKLERPLVLEHFLDYLQNQSPEKVKKVIGLFQSYAAFDVIRLISKNPPKFKNFMPVFFLDNPVGFNGAISIVAHVLRWQFMHVGIGLVKQVLNRFWGGAFPLPRGDAARDDYRRRELHDLWVWWKNTLKNPVRGGIRELLDICRYRAEEDMQKILKAGYEVGMFKHAGDQLLPIQQTLKYAQNLFTDKLVILDGGHNDLFIQPKNRKQIADTMYIEK